MRPLKGERKLKFKCPNLLRHLHNLINRLATKHHAGQKDLEKLAQKIYPSEMMVKTKSPRGSRIREAPSLNQNLNPLSSSLEIERILKPRDLMKED